MLNFLMPVRASAQCALHTTICKINYFIPLKPQYIRRIEIRTSILVHIARMPQTLCFSSMKLLLHLWKCLEQITVEKKPSSLHLLCLFIFDKLFVAAFCIFPL